MDSRKEARIVGIGFATMYIACMVLAAVGMG